jgi:hypothetical protein
MRVGATQSNSVLRLPLKVLVRRASGRLFLRRRVRPSDASGPTTSIRSNTLTRKLAGCHTWRAADESSVTQLGFGIRPAP